MSNTYGISDRVEREIRARDKRCVYCHRPMEPSTSARGPSEATMEHFNNDGPFDKKRNVAICCRSCNSSRRDKSLAEWFKTPYCRGKSINKETVSKPVREYMRLEKLIGITTPDGCPSSIGAMASGISGEEARAQSHR